MGRAGRRSAADHLAVLSGSTVGAALGVLATSKRLEALPVVVKAVAEGRLSALQLQSVADAAAAAPDAQSVLVSAAGRESVSELRERCGRGQGDCRRPRRRSHLPPTPRHGRCGGGRCPDGAAELTYRSTPDEVADVLSVVRAFADRLFKAAHKAGMPEASEAHLADGLLAAVRHAAAGQQAHGPAVLVPPSVTPTATAADTVALEMFPPAPSAASPTPDQLPAPPGNKTGERPVRVIPKTVIVRVDWDALTRGWPQGGEVCEIAGVGPVPVSAVKAMIESGDAVLKAVVTKGVDVINVAHLGRHPTVAQQTALQWLDLICVEHGCGQRAYLEIDHTLPWATTRITLLELLQPRCKHHHRLKTRQDLIATAANRQRAGPDR